MIQWFDITEIPVPVDAPVLTRRSGGLKDFACYHRAPHASGIIKLQREGDSFKWDGQSYLLKVTHWREIAPEDLSD